MNTFLIASTIVFFFLASIWSRKKFLDFVIKLLLWAMCIYGTFLILEANGYIISTLKQTNQ